MLTVSPALSRKPKVSNSIQQTNSTCNYDPATDSTLEYTTPDQSTEGGTGDSGFEEPLLKVPLNPKGNLKSMCYVIVHIS